MTIEELYAIQESIGKKMRDKWELVQLQTFHLMQPHFTEEARKEVTPQDVFPLPWKEVKKDPTELSEDKTAILKRLEKAKPTNKVAKL
ncbi:hypothetical protein [Carboxylicivirga marina]|uniref:Uncharacterized protein n=1 Tax=Carboxylicivirga marina TaxID=2800988 RepID=A0ABS1HGG6_9BACT|nr:hypothetical protein [Carboxylicivirga marina]MBK3516710.1 hypothetical protein [Carboxylicivirga marina]